MRINDLGCFLLEEKLSRDQKIGRSARKWNMCGAREAYHQVILLFVRVVSLSNMRGNAV